MVDAGAVWSAEDTSPGDIEEALRKLLREQYERDEACAPARVLNLVVVVDREWRGEILNRLERVGRYHPSRTILCAVEPRRTTIDATVALTSQDDSPGDGISLTRERIVLDLGERHLAKLDTIVDPLVVTDIATLVWSPHGHPEALDALLHLSQVVLIDSVNEPDAGSCGRARPRARRGRLRGRPRLAARHALARAGGLDLRPAAVARGARPDRQGDRSPPARLGDRRGALLRLAGLAARLGDGLADAGEWRAARQGARAAPGRCLHARARRGPERARPGGHRDRDGVRA